MGRVRRVRRLRRLNAGQAGRSRPGVCPLGFSAFPLATLANKVSAPSAVAVDSCTLPPRLDGESAPADLEERRAGESRSAAAAASLSTDSRREVGGGVDSERSSTSVSGPWGKRSLARPSKMGRSTEVILGTLHSTSARKARPTSGASGSERLSLAAAVMTALALRRPQS